MRLVILGGSGSSTPELFDALSDWPNGVDRRPAFDVVLVGRSPEKLSVVARECRRRIAAGGALVGLATSTDRRAALEGADIVLNQVRVGGYAARAFDESFPWEAGLPGEETMGPGGFANACRTLPEVALTWDDVAAVAPNALVVNLTNPAGIVQAAAHRAHPELRVVSVCDSPMPMLAAIADRLDRPLARVRRRYLGMNHLGWYVPEEAAELDAIADLAVGVEPDVVRIHEALPAPYVRYYVHPDRILAAQRGRETRAQALQKLDATLLDGYAATGAGELPRRGALVWYRDAVLTLIDAVLHGSDVPVLAGVRNAGRVRWLPGDAVIELAHETKGAGEGEQAELVPSDPVELPALPRALLAAHGWYEVTVASADLSDPDERLRALLTNPLVRGVDQAAMLLAAIRAHGD